MVTVIFHQFYVLFVSIRRYTRFKNGGNQIKNAICKKNLKHWKVSWYLSLSKFIEQDLSYKNWKKSWFVFSRLVFKFPLMLSLYNLYTNTLRRYTISGKWWFRLFEKCNQFLLHITLQQSYLAWVASQILKRKLLEKHEKKRTNRLNIA